ncbi:MAG: rhodanese-related sulfurtransferase [Candidatus Pacebacteria bacterium]|nr:rhodanese-related sulfurtransferase [Candidatus Paceibacterota bacterium]
MNGPNEWQVLLFYKYIPVEDPAALAEAYRIEAQKLGLTGRAIIAAEGINATFEGSVEATEALASWVLTDSRFSDMQIKRSAGNGESFPRLSVKVRDEIVGTGFTKDEADPYVKTAPRLTPEQLKAWYESNRDFVVVDMRNNYEYASGHFKNAVQPDISASRHLPIAMNKLEPLKEKTVVTVCTGGVRCEKMSAYLLSKGFTDVHQLDGGIHSYMEKFPGQDFEGTLYTFDKRLTMDFGGDRSVIGQCHLCKRTTERYVDCAEDTCHYHFLACENCTDERGRAYCSDECKHALV